MKKNGVVIVTGSSRGIGKAIALALAREGLRVVINYLQSEKEAGEVVQEIKKMDHDAFEVKADVAKMEDVELLVDEAIKQFGSIDYLVNNAGVILRPGDWKDITEETWRRTIDVDLKGVFNCIKVVAPYMLKQRQGKIVNLTSTYGIIGAAPVIAYTASKAGVINLTRSFAKELAPYITVNAVAPGNIETELTASAGKEFLEQVIQSTPLRRLGKPEDVANAVVFLLSDKSDFITGHVLVVDGGHMMR